MVIIDTVSRRKNPMAAPLPSRTSALLTGAGLLFAAGALLGILLPIRAEIQGFAAVLIGLIGSAFAVGHVTGCFLVPRLAGSVGHIRCSARWRRWSRSRR